MHRQLKIIYILLTLVFLMKSSFGKELSFDPVIIDFDSMHFHAGPLSGIDIKDFKSDIAINSSWKPLSTFDTKELSGKNELWVRIEVPDIKVNNMAISIRSYLNSFELYTDGKVFEHNPEAEGENFRYYSNHIIPIDNPDTEYLYMRILYNYPANFGKIYTVLFGDKESLYNDIINIQQNLLHDILDEMFLGMILFIFGTVSLFVFIIRLKHKDYPFLTFGLFSILAGVIYNYGMRFQFYINISPVTSLLIENLSFLFMFAALFAFIEQIFLTDKRIFIVRKIWQIHIVVAAVTAITLLNNDYNEAFINIIMFLSTLACFYVILRSKTEESHKLKTPFLIFLAILVLLGINQICESIFQYYLVNNLVRLFFDINWQRDVFGIGILGLTFALGYILIMHYTNMIRNMQKVSLELEKNKSEILKLSQAKLESQFDALKNQLNPHFLFNNFSTLISIIEESSENAVNFVQELSQVYRYILKTRISELVDLSTEINFVKSYEYLMKQRFGENIRLSIEIPDEFLNYKIPPFSLQLLIENAVKHNIISKKKPLNIKLYEKNCYIVVTNNLQKKNVIETSTNIGLSNIENRYKYFTEREILIMQTEKDFTVKLPLLKRKEWLQHEDTDH